MQKTIPVIGVPVQPHRRPVVANSDGSTKQTIQAADASNQNRGLMVSYWEKILSTEQQEAYCEMKKQFEQDEKYKSLPTKKTKRRSLFAAKYDYLESLKLEVPEYAQITQELKEHRTTVKEKKKIAKEIKNHNIAIAAAKNAKKQLMKKAKVITIPQVGVGKSSIKPLMEVDVQGSVPSHMSYQNSTVQHFQNNQNRGYNWKSEFSGKFQFQPVVDYTAQEKFGGINRASGYEYPRNEWMNHSWPPTQDQAGPSYFNLPTSTSSSTYSSFLPPTSYSSVYPQQQFLTPGYSEPPVQAPAHSALAAHTGSFAPEESPTFALTAMVQAARGYAPQSLSPQMQLNPGKRSESVHKSSEPSQYAQQFLKVSEQPSESVDHKKSDEEEKMRRRLKEIERQLEEIERQKEENLINEELRRKELELQQREQWMTMREQELLSREMMNAKAAQEAELRRRGRSRSRSRERERERRSSHHHYQHHHHYDEYRYGFSPSDRNPQHFPSKPSRREIMIETRDRLREARDAEAARRDGQRGDKRKRFGPASSMREDTSYSENRSSRIQEAIQPARPRPRRRRDTSPIAEFISDGE